MDHPAPTASGQVSPFSEQWQTATNETQRLQNEEGNVRINETTASGQDVGGGDAAGRTPAMPKETGSQDGTTRPRARNVPLLKRLLCQLH